MGYRSDVSIVVAFDNLDNMKEVLAVYLLDPRVKEHDLMQHWKTCQDVFEPQQQLVGEPLQPITTYYLKLYEQEWKWYDNYEDVQGLQHLYLLAMEFAENRKFAVAWKEVSIGEDGAIEADEGNSNDLLQEFCDELLGYSHPEIIFDDTSSKEIALKLGEEK
tara:strand:+ start:333 stop:818 length:486 start_codon:yes stop_codon:yes gene_type:complete